MLNEPIPTLNLTSDPVALRVLLRTHRRLTAGYKSASNILRGQDFCRQIEAKLKQVCGSTECRRPEAWRA